MFVLGKRNLIDFVGIAKMKSKTRRRRRRRDDGLASVGRQLKRITKLVTKEEEEEEDELGACCCSGLASVSTRKEGEDAQVTLLFMITLS